MKYYFPQKIHIETVLGCNSRCIICPNSDTKNIPIKRMSDSLFKKIIKEALSIPSIKSIKLSVNGETLLDNKIAEKVLFIKKQKNIRVTFNTNASLLTKKMSEKIIKSGLDRINFHVSGFSLKVYNNIMIGLSRKKVFTNILNFQKIAKKCNSKIIMAIKYVVINKNIKELNKAKKFWESRRFLFRPDVLDDRVDDLRNYTKLQMTQSNNQISNPCPLIFKHFFIRYNGNVISCWSDWYSQRIFGNCKSKKILDIFNNQKFNKLRKEHFEGKRFSKSICSKCFWKEKNE